MTYQAALQYLESFLNYEKIPAYPYRESEFKLERIKGFLKSIGDPQDALKCIHIAGSKGKGSTCAFISYILKEAGYKVGLYTSPHLSDFRERIRILLSLSACRLPVSDYEGLISRRDLARIVSGLKPYIDKFNVRSRYGALSFFETYTALAFVYFKERKVDFAVLETGLGGRLDATNVVNGYLSAITPISYEHTQKLGNTLKEIAREKAGIIKVHHPPAASRQPIVISAPQPEQVRQVIRAKCKAVAAKLYEVNKDILCKKTKSGFSIKGVFAEYPHLKIRLLGEHQLTNAAVAVGAIESLRYYHIAVAPEAIRNGLYHTLWPGRCEVLSKRPLVVLDGAQNIASAQALKKAVKDNFHYQRLILVLGISCDKDIKGICQEICPLADQIVITEANSPRAADTRIIEQVIRRQKPAYKKQIIQTKTVKEARLQALKTARQEDLILVTGSLFVVGEFRDA